VRAGYNASFVARAVSYPSTQMWYPTVSELKAAQVITGTTDAYRFAASGYGIKPGTEDFEKELRGQSIFRAIEQAAPRVFRELAEQFQRGYVQGVPEAQLVDEIRESRITPLLVSRLTTADNGTAVDYARLLSDQYETLGSKDSKLCYDYATKGATTAIGNLFPSELRNRELALNERVLTATHSGPKRTSDQLASIYGRVVQKLRAQYGAENVAVLESSQIKPSQYPLYCRLITAMFREISKLPISDAGDVMRDIFSELAATRRKK
jgi:hypothetical protein